MKNYLPALFLAFVICSCRPEVQPEPSDGSGSFSGAFTFGNFEDNILFDVIRDSTDTQVFFTSLAQNALRIPMRQVQVDGDSISFALQSDFFTYSFRNKWSENRDSLVGTLFVDTVAAPYVLVRSSGDLFGDIRREEVQFQSDSLTIHGTIWHPEEDLGKALVFVTSSGSADRSASAAQAALFAQRGYTAFHYDKRGTGNTAGDWQQANMQTLLDDDLNALRFFEQHSGIPFSNTALLGSSQGASKVPYLLNSIEGLACGVAVSCPGVSLLESDLNYWKNRNAEALGPDIDAAAGLQGKVFEFIAGTISRQELERALNSNRNADWFGQIWVPDLDEIRTDPKLTYSPIPYFEKLQQPVLIVQGKADEIIPPDSHSRIEAALETAGNSRRKTVMLDGASHSMNKVGGSDFPYWSRLHPGYIDLVDQWLVDQLEKE